MRTQKGALKKNKKNDPEEVPAAAAEILRAAEASTIWANLPNPNLRSPDPIWVGG